MVVITLKRLNGKKCLESLNWYDLTAILSILQLNLLLFFSSLTWTEVLEVTEPSDLRYQVPFQTASQKVAKFALLILIYSLKLRSFIT